MWNQIIGALVGAAGGAAYGGYTTYKAAKKNADVYKNAALLYNHDTNKYSGENANAAMTQAGMQQGRIQNAGTMNAAASQAQRGNSTMANALRGADNVGASNSYGSGYSTGAQNKATLNNAAFNRDTALAQQLMNQADINYKRDTAMNQLGLNTAAGAVNTYKNVVSDEDAKSEPQEYNNHSGLPKADVDDALRKVESIQYQYKPEMGLDDEEHVGVTAQSVEDTAFNDMVSTGDNGYKQLDKQMMLEAVFAGIASLRKELDELESDDNTGNNKITSDEECKTVEKAIENNPKEAAAALPEGSNIQKEAEQAIDGGRDAEVNNDVVSKYIGLLKGSVKPDTVITDDGREISRDEYAAEMAQFKEDNPEDILKERETAKAAAREEAAEMKAESNKLVDMAKEVAGEGGVEVEDNDEAEDSAIDKAIDGAMSVASTLFGSMSSRTTVDTASATIPPGDSFEDNTDNTDNTNFSSGASNKVSAETSGGLSAPSVSNTTTDNSEASNDKSFSGNGSVAQTNAQRVNVGANGMLSSSGNGGTVSSGATKDSAKNIKSKEQKLPSNEAQTQDYSETLSGEEMRDTYVKNLNEQSKAVNVESVDNEPEMSTYNGVPFDKLDNDQLKEVEVLLSNI